MSTKIEKITHNAVGLIQPGAILQDHVGVVDARRDGAHPVVILATLEALQAFDRREQAQTGPNRSKHHQTRPRHTHTIPEHHSNPQKTNIITEVGRMPLSRLSSTVLFNCFMLKFQSR